MSNNFVLRIFAFRVKTVDNETIAEYNLIATEKVAIKVCFFSARSRFKRFGKNRTKPKQNKPRAASREKNKNAK